MSNLPSIPNYIQTEATRFRSAVSESLAQAEGQSINYLLDHVSNLDTEVAGILARILNVQFSTNVPEAHIENPASNVIDGLTYLTQFNVTITKKLGTYIRCFCVSDQTVTPSVGYNNPGIYMWDGSGNTVALTKIPEFGIKRGGGTVIYRTPFTFLYQASGQSGPALGDACFNFSPISQIDFFDFNNTAAGTFTYGLGLGRYAAGSSTLTQDFFIQNMTFVVQELQF
jgi:hypothetical protein